MATLVYPFPPITDDFGALVSDATVTIVSVKTADGTDISGHGATLHQWGSNVSVGYDAATHGEAWVTLSVVKSGASISGWRASPSRYLAVESGGGTPPEEPAEIILNFRNTLAYVTDGTNERAVLDTTDSNSLNNYTWHWAYAPGGWISDDSAASPYAPELSGCVWQTFDNDYNEFIVTLPQAGDYDVGIALGSAQWSNTVQSAAIFDDTTLVKTICDGVTTTIGNYVDITGTVVSAADWQANRTTTRLTFSSTTLRLRIAYPAATNTSVATTLSCLIVRKAV